MTKQELHLGYGIYFAVGLSLNLLFAMLPDVRDTFKLNYSEAGNIMGVLQIGFITSLMLRMKLLNYLGMKRLLLVTGVSWLAGIGLMTLTVEKNLLLVGVMLTGIAYGMFQNLYSAYAVMTSKKDKNRHVSMMNAFFGIGSVAAPLTASAALAVGNWRTGYLVVFAVVLLMLVRLLQLTFLPVSEGTDRQKAPFSFGLTFLYIGLFIVIYPLGEFTAGSWASEYWKNFGNNTVIPYSMITAFFWIPFTVGRIRGGVLADRIGGMVFMLRTCGLFLAASLVWVMFTSPWITLVSLVVIAYSLAGMFPIFLILAGEYYPQHIGTITSWLFFFLSMGGMGTQKVVGLAAEAFGIGILPMVFLAAALLLISVLLGLRHERSKVGGVT